MAMHEAAAGESAERPGISPFARARKILSRRGLLGPSQEAVPAAEATDLAEPTELSFLARVRKFVWLSSGMLGAAAFAMPALGVFALGAIDPESLGTSFLVGVACASLFGLTSVLRFGPDEA
jgi:hypothetical protein